MKSVVSYEERGNYGNNRYRGNCSGRLIEDIIDQLYILRWRSHPISWNRAMESVIESHSSDGGSHDPCRGSQ